MEENKKTDAEIANEAAEAMGQCKRIMARYIMAPLAHCTQRCDETAPADVGELIRDLKATGMALEDAICGDSDLSERIAKVAAVATVAGAMEPPARVLILASACMIMMAKMAGTARRDAGDLTELATIMADASRGPTDKDGDNGEEAQS